MAYVLWTYNYVYIVQSFYCLAWSWNARIPAASGVPPPHLTMKSKMSYVACKRWITRLMWWREFVFLYIHIHIYYFICTRTLICISKQIFYVRAGSSSYTYTICLFVCYNHYILYIKLVFLTVQQKYFSLFM